MRWIDCRFLWPWFKREAGPHGWDIHDARGAFLIYAKATWRELTCREIVEIVRKLP